MAAGAQQEGGRQIDRVTATGKVTTYLALATAMGSFVATGAFAGTLDYKSPGGSSC